MSPLNKEQLNQIREERKDQILKAALKIFARKGIVGTKLSMIATEASISQGLLYHYFSSKDELFIHLVQEASQGALDALGMVYQLPGSPIEKLRTLTHYILNGNGQLSFMLIHQTRTSDDVPKKAKQLIDQFSMEDYINQLCPLFKDGQKAGEFAEGDPKQLISCYLSVLSGLMILNIHQDEGYQTSDIDLLMRIVTGRP